MHTTTLHTLLSRISQINFQTTVDTLTPTPMQFETPSYPPALPHLPIQSDYTIYQLNQQIIAVLSTRYQCPERVIEPPKTTGPDRVISIKQLYDKIDGASRPAITTLSSEIYDYLTEMQAQMPRVATLQLTGIYINITVTPAYHIHTLQHIQRCGHQYGAYSEHPVQKIIIDYSSPNVAKQMGIHHLCSTMIGQITTNLLNTRGHQVMRRNYLGDRGTPFGKVVYMLISVWKVQWITLFDQLLSDPTATLGQLYSSYKDVEDVEKDQRARLYFALLEQGHPDLYELWGVFRSLSLQDFDQIYNLFGIYFDTTLGESFSQTMVDTVISDLEQHQFLIQSEWAQVVKLLKQSDSSYLPLTSTQASGYADEDLEIVLMKKSDGATVYAARDLALVRYKNLTLGGDQFVYVVAIEQQLSFLAVDALAQALGYIQPWQLQYMGYGLLLQWGKKMSTRKGKLYRLCELIDEVAKNLCVQNIQLTHDTAQKLAVSCIIFSYIKGDVYKDSEFDSAQVTQSQGDTGVYLHYTRVRLLSLIEKLKSSAPQDQSTSLSIDHLSPLECTIIMQLSLLPQVIDHCLALSKPHPLAQYTLSVCTAMNKWYNDTPKLIDLSPDQQVAKMLRLQQVITVIDTSFGLMHLPHIDAM